ncbi:MAG: hypothetical protein KAT28_01770 [Candidatus Aenigmarchaeota archaeon]|nr:hypothetical protein [Candidatus Aenigmarchaeota archaeon]
MAKIDTYKKQIKKYKNKLIKQDVVKNIFEKSTELVKLTKEGQKYLKKLPVNEKKIITEHIKNIKYKYKTLERLFKKKEKRKAIDKFFYSFDELPILGKEYWFMKFISEGGSKTQFFFMFGRTTGDMTLNGKYIKDKQLGPNKYNGYSVGWGYDNKQKSIVNDLGSIEISDNKINIENGSVSSYFSGTFPKYNLKVSKNNKEICNLKITEPKDKSLKFEFCEYHKAFFGYDLINLYFDFEGKLFNKKFKGKCYIQKVVAVGPFIPWRWARVIFKNKSVLTYFEINPEIFGLKYNKCLSYYDSVSKKTYDYLDMDIHDFPGSDGKVRWIVESKKNDLYICMKTYGKEVFDFKRKGNFIYIEYLVEVTDLSLKINNKNIGLKNVGRGVGIVEDTRGYVI